MHIWVQKYYYDHWEKNIYESINKETNVFTKDQEMKKLKNVYSHENMVEVINK